MIQTLQHVWMSAKIQMSKAVFGTAQVSRDRMSPEIDSKYIQKIKSGCLHFYKSEISHLYFSTYVL